MQTEKLTKQKVIDILVSENRNDSRCSKDGGRSFCIELAQRLSNTVDEDKQIVYQVFIDEICNDENALYGIAIETIRLLHAVELGNVIAEKYILHENSKNLDWRRDVILLLISLDFVDKSFIYLNFMNAYSNWKQDYAFLVNYSKFDFHKTFPYLAQLIIDIMEKNHLTPQSFGYLYLRSYFMRQPNRVILFSSLCNMMCIKNKQKGKLFADILIKDIVERYKPCTVIEEVIKGIELAVA
ncbi:MAG: hypothetical protein KBA02_05260 [Paludibacteraceae bacterium]|nr:hypothetical protein [Paludibacteraceae bacterium]